MAIDTIKFKRGVKSKLNNLSYGEPAYISDENELYIGTENGVEKITRNKEVAELSSQLEQNMTKVNEQFKENENNNAIVNIKKFGAKLDGVSDDSLALLNAIKTEKKVYIPDKIYIGNNITIENLSNVEIIGNNDTIIYTKKDMKAITINNCDNVKLNNFKHIGDGTDSTLSLNQLFAITNCRKVEIFNTEIKDSINGFYVENVENLKVYNNISSNNKGWGIYFLNCDNAEIYGNECFNNVCDGLKATGYINNVLVHDNVCYNNIRDGFDFAGHSCNNLKVYNNNFYGNGVDGIEIKTLDRETYPLPDDIINPEFKNIEIYNNSISTNSSGINISNRNSSTITSKNIKIYNNNIYNNEDRDSNKNGIRVANIIAETKEDLFIDSNFIHSTSIYRGIRIVNCQNGFVKNNNVRVFQNGILTEIQTETNINTNDIIIEDNKVVVENSNAIVLNTDTHNNIVRRNNLKSPLTSYRLKDSGTDNKLYDNIVNEEMREIISDFRGFKGELLYSYDKTYSNCIGWVMSESGTDKNLWKPFGTIQ